MDSDYTEKDMKEFEVMLDNAIGALKKIKERVCIVNDNNRPDHYVKDRVLKIAVNGENNNLLIGYFIDKIWYGVGYISGDGECNILNTHVRIQNYSNWMKTDRNYDDYDVIWNKGHYRLMGSNLCTLMREDIEDGQIYDFGLCIAIEGCLDENIKRIPSFNRPILF